MYGDRVKEPKRPEPRRLIKWLCRLTQGIYINIFNDIIYPDFILWIVYVFHNEIGFVLYTHEGFMLYICILYICQSAETSKGRQMSPYHLHINVMYNLFM
jgi:hypothetical protein